MYLNLKCFPTRAPTDCRQYFTGASGTVSSYNFGGKLMLAAQQYTNCFRQELGTTPLFSQNNLEISK